MILYETVRTFRDKDRGRCRIENIEVGSEWTSKDRKTETEVERCYTKRTEGVQRETEVERCYTTRTEGVEREKLRWSDVIRRELKE